MLKITDCKMHQCTGLHKNWLKGTVGCNRTNSRSVATIKLLSLVKHIIGKTKNGADYDN